MKKKSHALRNIVLLIIVVPLLAVGFLLATFDANAYRPQIAQALSDQLGREVKLDGPINLGVSLSHGFNLSVKDVIIANPSWASRPYMAKAGTIALGVALPPLLQKKINVTRFALKDADVLLETNGAGRNNWDFQTAKVSSPAPAKDEQGQEASAKPMAFHVGEIDLSDIKFAKREKDGKTAQYLVNHLKISWQGKGVTIKLDADMNGQNVVLDVASSSDVPLDKIMETAWPFDATAKYGSYTANLKGTLDNPKKQVENTYEIVAGGSKLAGQMTIAYGGARPTIVGTMNSDKLDPADFKSEAKEESAKAESVDAKDKAGATGDERIFSAEPLDLSGLKAADVRMEVKIGQLVMGAASMKDLQTKIDLANGRLLLSPFKTKVADKDIEGVLKVDAENKPVQVQAAFKAYQIDLSELVKLGGLSSFIESKGDADMDITASGNSMHELASSANGRINMVMAGGSVSGQMANELGSDLLNIFAPGTGGLTKPGLNCLAAHLVLTNGVLETKGLLIDSAQATIAGTGGANLRDETLDMVLRARTKGPDVSKFTKVDINSIAPPLKIGGTLANPSFHADASGTVQKAIGLFTGGAAGDTGVPALVEQSGQNACEYTLRNPQAQPASKPAANVNEVVDKAKEKVKDVGSKVMEGLGGLFGK